MNLLSPALLWFWLVLVYVVLVFLLQFLSGTYGSELAHWPDEPAHVTSALMVRD